MCWPGILFKLNTHFSPRKQILKKDFFRPRQQGETSRLWKDFKRLLFYIIQPRAFRDRGLKRRPPRVFQTNLKKSNRKFGCKQTFQEDIPYCWKVHTHVRECKILGSLTQWNFCDLGFLRRPLRLLGLFTAQDGVELNSISCRPPTSNQEDIVAVWYIDTRLSAANKELLLRS